MCVGYPSVMASLPIEEKGALTESEQLRLTCRPCVRCGVRRTAVWCDYCEDFEEVNDLGERCFGRAHCNVCEETHACCPICEAKDRPNQEPHCWICNEPSTMHCGRCKAVNYCSLECQRKGWLWHKDTCEQ